jgi:hypothetical protein
MKRGLVFLAAAVLVLSLLPVTAIDTGGGIGVDIETEKFIPLIWMCNDRVVLDDNVEPGRIHCDNCIDGEILVERVENYAFEGEQIHWDVLVMDKNGIEKIKDVYMTVGDTRDNGKIEANCKLDEVLDPEDTIPEECNARIGEELLSGQHPSENTMAYYECTLTVESPELMMYEYWVDIKVEDLDNQIGSIDEKEKWFFNPEIALEIDCGDNCQLLSFEEGVRPGVSAYSQAITVGNGAEEGSGVLLDMFVTGTDFYDSSSSGAKCPDTNQLALTNFAYHAANGAYSTDDDSRADAEGYNPICYGDRFETTLYNKCEIIQNALNAEGYYAGNVLSPGADISMTFRLDLPEPCNGDFDTGQIFFWGEAI